MTNAKRRVWLALIAALLPLMIVAGTVYAQTVRYDSIIAKKITVTGAGGLTVAEDATVLGDLVVAGDLVTITHGISETGNSALTNVTIAGTLQVNGNVSDGNSALTIADNVMIDGAADVVQLTVQSNGTQTALPFVVENSAGTDEFTVSNAGAAVATTSIQAGTFLTVGTFIESAPQLFTVVNATPITPTKSLLRLTSAGTVTVTTIVAASSGVVLTLLQTAAQTINIVDGSNLKMAGNVALGQFDTIMFVSDGVNWLETSRTNN